MTPALKLATLIPESEAPESTDHKVSPFVGSRTPSERLHLADAPALAPFHSDSGFDARRDVQSPHTDKNAYLRENHHTLSGWAIPRLFAFAGGAWLAAAVAVVALALPFVLSNAAPDEEVRPRAACFSSLQKKQGNTGDHSHAVSERPKRESGRPAARGGGAIGRRSCMRGWRCKLPVAENEGPLFRACSLQ